jgi:hypothetical protein
MKACGSSPAGQRGQRSRRAPERALAWSPPVEGTSVSGKPVALTCQRWKRDQAVCSGLLRQPSRRPSRERCQRVPIDGAAARLTRPQRSTPPGAKVNQGGSRGTRSRQRAVKRAAVGGRMTARWSGVFSGDAETRARRGSGSRTPAGLPTALGRQPPKGKSRRVLVTRNVGCRNGFRGTLVPPPRKAARPHEGWRHRATGRGD